MRADRRGWGVVAGVAVVILLLDALRVFLPSIIFIFGRAGSTPATTMGVFAGGWFAAGFLALPVGRALGARRLAIGSAAAFLVARLALLATDGGDPQLYLAGVSFVLATWTLIGVADASTDRWPSLGAVLGVPVATVMHLGMDTVDPQWSGAAGWLLIAVLAGALVAATARMPTSSAEATGGPAPAGFWWRLGPVVLLAGVISAVPGWQSWWLAVWVPMLVVGLVLAWDPSFVGEWTAVEQGAVSRNVRHVLAALVAVGVALTVFAGLEPVGPPLVALAPLALFLHSAPDGRVRRAGVGAAVAGLLIGLVGFVYYAGYDIALGDNRLILIACGLLLFGRAATAPEPGPFVARRRRPLGQQLALVVPVSLVAAAVVAAPTAPPSPPTIVPSSASVRVAIANIHMGWDTRGRFAIDRIAGDLAALDADVIVLNEVDRGWLLTGGHDTLRLLGELLDMPHVFAPAADDVWGNAILSSLPLHNVDVQALPRGGVPMRRSTVSATITLASTPAATTTIGVVGTHLHHVEGDDSVRAEQATAVAEIVAGHVTSGRPTLLLGDLNAVPGDPALSSLTDLLDDAVAPADPLPTFPAWEPDERIDHILASPGLVISDIERGGGPDSSDHLWLAVTIALP